MPRMTVRKYACECGHSWESCYPVRLKNIPVEDCPSCAAKASQAPANGIADILAAGRGPAVGKRIASAAGDITMNMLEQDYGISASMINDNVRTGDIGVKAPPVAKHDEVKYLETQARTQIDAFLAQGRASGGLGENNLSGFDIIKAGTESGKIMDPRRHMVALTAKD